jgi:hypothetical protein
MGQVGKPPNGRPRSRLPLAVLLSLAFHGLFALFVFAVSSTGGRPPDAPVDTLVTVPVEQFSLFLVSAPSSRPAPPCPAPVPPAPEPEAPFTVRVDAPPAVPASPSIQIASRDSTGQADGQSPEEASGGGMSTRNAPATFFGATAPARSVVYVIDRSISMGLNGGLAAAREELLASLECLPATARFQVLLYNRTVRSLHGGGDGLVPASAEARHEVAALVADLRAEGGTSHLPALRQALALHPDLILLFTDADDLSLQDVQTLTRLNRGGTAIHTIEWTNESHADGPLALLARLNRGTYRSLVRR